jgi:phosphatidate cytidylyltransferase
MVLPRVLTAVVMAPLFLWVLYLGQLPFAAFVWFLVALALWEFHRMGEMGGHATQGVWGLLGGLAVVTAMTFPGVRPAAPWRAQAPAFAIAGVAFLWMARELARRDKGLSVLRLAMSAAGLLFVALPLGFLTLLRELRGDSAEFFNVGRDAALLLVAIVWAQDTAAWAVGMAFGRHRLAPVVSPKKSWEGAAGGLAAAVAVALFLREAWMRPLFGRGEVVLLAVALGVLAQVSDLAESLLKRCLGVKDSSTLLPGHGGVLDRFDSFLFSAPFFYYYLVSIGKGA